MVDFTHDPLQIHTQRACLRITQTPQMAARCGGWADMAQHTPKQRFSPGDTMESFGFARARTHAHTHARTHTREPEFFFMVALQIQTLVFKTLLAAILKGIKSGVKGAVGKIQEL